MTETAHAQRFEAILEKDDQTSGTYLIIPFDVSEVFGTRGRVPVEGTINGYPFRTSISPYGGKHYLGINREIREGAQVSAGDRVEIVLRRDEEPRQVDVPDDLAQALAENGTAQAAWERLSYSHRREYVKAIQEAKMPETRARRIGKTIQDLAKKEK